MQFAKNVRLLLVSRHESIKTHAPKRTAKQRLQTSNGSKKMNRRQAAAEPVASSA